MKSQKGFTLIELMIVVAIIAILAAIALPQYRNYTARAKITAAVASVAGEKIKVAENNSAGKTDNAGLCSEVANCSGKGVLTGTKGTDTSITLTPTIPDDGKTQITWVCKVGASQGSAYNNKSCDDLGGADLK